MEYYSSTLNYSDVNISYSTRLPSQIKMSYEELSGRSFCRGTCKTCIGCSCGKSSF